MTPFVLRHRLTRIKAAIRTHIPPRQWVRLARLLDKFSSSFAAVIAGLFAYLLHALPDRVSVSLREKLTLRRYLDYDRAPILLQVTSLVELKTRLRSCEKEPETVHWIHTTFGPGDVLYDIGANIGAYSLVAASHTNGKAFVYAFEPSFRTFKNLAENILVNGFEGIITPLQVALADHTGICTFWYANLEAGSARHFGISHQSQCHMARFGQPVVCYRLDDCVRALSLRAPTHIKLDVDGMEVQILQGAKQLLTAPALRSILVEAEQSTRHSRSLKDFLHAQGFEFVGQHPRGNTGACNLIFLRQEKVLPR